MDGTLIFAGSITYAMKARDILNKNGIATALRKNQVPSLNGGCNYEIYVKKDVEKAMDILRNAGINVVPSEETEAQNDLS